MTDQSVPLFPVFEIEDHDAQIPENLGTKEKFWVKHEGALVLLKFGREGTGEDWSEKLACEMCKLLDLRHAHYELALHRGRRCVISPSIIEADGRLILGNEIINRVVKNYDGTRSYQQREHTISRVLASIRVFTGANYTKAWHDFIGYLLLDAWIGNTDRHHENWGLMINRDRSVVLAPTFDHASSMGRELSDEERVERLTTKDQRYNVPAFARRARSALYMEPTDKKPMLVRDAYQFAARAQRESGFHWLRKLQGISDEQVAGIVDRVPSECMSQAAKDFAMAVLTTNREALLALLEPRP